jgi:hypothetical protein
MNKYTVLTILLVLGVLLIFFGIPYTDSQLRSEFKNFNETNLDGAIEYVKIKHHGDCFKLVNNSTELLFYSIPVDKSSTSLSFSDLAKKGDRIVKRANSDTLTLVKSGEIYLFTFSKE